MSGFGLNTTGLRPRHPYYGYPDFPLPEQVPTKLIEAWYHAPAVTAFERVGGGSVVEVRELGWELYNGEDRAKWEEAFVHVDVHAVGLEAVAPPAGCRLVNFGRETVAKIDNWMSVIPLPLVLLKFDAAYNVPARRQAADPRSLVLMQFAQLLIDLGLVRGISRDSDNAATFTTLEALVPWLEQHFPIAVALWLWTYTHVYHNARTDVDRRRASWSAQLRTIQLDFGRAEWLKYLAHLHAGRLANDLYPSQGEFFKHDGHSVLPLPPVFTDFYLAVHPEREQLLENASRANVTPRLPPLETPSEPSESYKPGARRGLRHAASGLFRKK